RNGGIFFALQLRKQNDEFVSTLPTNRVGTTHTIHQAPCNRLKQFVANRVAQGIVDIFETVQIEKQNCDLVDAARRQCDRLANPVVQQHSIGQVGQKIVFRQVGHLLRHRAGSAHVTENNDGSGGLPFTVVDGSDTIF